jgi:chromatin remodeling complex protein RSC6
MSGFKITDPQPLSRPFQTFMGRPSATRSEVYSAICAHIRENDLKDSDGGVTYDSLLAKLLKTRGATRFTEIMSQIATSGAFVAK